MGPISRQAIRDELRGLLKELEKKHPGSLFHAHQQAVVAVALGDSMEMDQEGLERLYYLVLSQEIVGRDPGQIGKLEKYSWFSSLWPLIRRYQEVLGHVHSGSEIRPQEMSLETSCMLLASLYVDLLHEGEDRKDSLGRFNERYASWFESRMVEALRRMASQVQFLDLAPFRTWLQLS